MLTLGLWKARHGFAWCWLHKEAPDGTTFPKHPLHNTESRTVELDFKIIDTIEQGKPRHPLRHFYLQIDRDREGNHLSVRALWRVSTGERSRTFSFSKTAVTLRVR